MKKCTLAISTFMAMGLTFQAQATGIKVITDCKSLSPKSKTQVSILMTRSIDYQARKASVEVVYAGAMEWDANPYKLVGKFSAELPVSNDPVPKLPRTFQVASGDSNVGLEPLNISPTADKLPLNAYYITMKAPATGGQYVALKLTMGAGKQSAFGALYITDKSATQVTTPDGGPNVDLSCTEEVHDI